MQYYQNVASELFRVTAAIDDFDGACDLAFDNDFDELERQFAELRLSLANDEALDSEVLSVKEA